MSEFLKVVHAVKAGNSALAAWQKIDPTERAAKLAALPKLMAESQSAVLQILSSETGASRHQNLDYQSAITGIEALLQKFRELQNFPDASYLPLGLVGLITGAKNPFSASLVRVVSALAMGNAVIWKPSTKVSQTLSTLLEIVFSKVELPDGLLTLLIGETNELSEAIIDHPAIHQLMFVGSTPVGKIVYARASQNGKKIQASMGARNASVIFADVNLEAQIESLTQTFFDFHGLGRWRASRIFVQESLYKQFLEKLKANLSQSNLAHLGTPKNYELEKFNSAFKQATDEKGKSLLDANSKNHSPAVIFDLTNCSTLQQEEVEGPLITVSSFKYQFDAIKFANTSPLGKAAYVWSGDLDKAKKVARKIEAGRVFVNEVPKSFFVDRYTAVKESGIGAEGLTDLLEFNSHKVNVT